MGMFDFSVNALQFKNMAEITPSNCPTFNCACVGGEFVYFGGIAPSKITRVGANSIETYNTPFGGSTIDALVFLNGTLFAFIGTVGIYTSNDTGKTWALLMATALNFVGAATDGKSTIVALVLGNVPSFISTDGGATFGSSGGSNVLAGPNPAQPETFKYSTFRSLYIYAGATGDVFTSIDGIAWTFINYPSILNNAYAVEIIDTNHFLVSTTGGRLHLGTINSATVSELDSVNFPYGENTNPGVSARITSILKTEKYIYYASSFSNIAVSNDGGAKFYPCTTTGESNGNGHMVYNGNGVYSGTSGGKIIKTFLG